MIFEEKVVELEVCVLVFSKTFFFFFYISHSEKNCAGFDKKNVYLSSCKVPIILARC
jgi:hypothetical protein